MTQYILKGLPTTFARQIHHAESLSIPRPSITQNAWYRNINLLSIDYAFRPRLRIRLTLGGRTFPRKPWAFGDQDSHLVFRYSCLHTHLCEVHGRFPFRFIILVPHTTLSYPSGFSEENLEAAASVSNFSPDHFRRRITRPVSYYALFK